MWNCLLLAQIGNNKGIDQSVSWNDVWDFFNVTTILFEL
jgi:hypothetical protein